MERKVFKESRSEITRATQTNNPFVSVAQLNDKYRNRNTTGLTVEQRTILSGISDCDLSDGKQTSVPTRYRLPRRF